MNVEGTISMIELAKKMLQLKVFLHVSTAYAHCHLETIEEQFYTKGLPLPNDLIKLVHSEDYDISQDLSSIGKHPNTYTFTKALAEKYLIENCAQIPIIIVRPSIVVAAWKEPFPGWVDNYNGPTGRYQCIHSCTRNDFYSMNCTPCKIFIF